jgi:hypothetical protein
MRGANVNVRRVSLYGGYICSDLLYRSSQLRLTPSGDENIRAFVDELLRRRQANAAVTAGNECNFSFKLTHNISPWLSFVR